jgi:nucleoside-diphosphate-sugar epimerase
MVGQFAIARLVRDGHTVLALSRNPTRQKPLVGVQWSGLDALTDSAAGDSGQLPQYWLSFCPIWALEGHFQLLLRARAEVVVALSSTSRFTKSAAVGASNAKDAKLAQRLQQSEVTLMQWAGQHGLAWIVLRPTLIYDFQQDRNVTFIATFIRRFGFFPLLGQASGLRQPVFAGDVADAAIASLHSKRAWSKDYNIAGAEILNYRSMVARIFEKLGKSPRFLPFPQMAFQLVFRVLKLVPGMGQYSASMAARMNQDMVFDNTPAERDFGYAPMSFLSDDMWRV